MASNTFKHQRPRYFKKSLVAILVLLLLLSLCLVSAQSSGDSPPPAQPGSDKSEPPTKTHGGDSGGGHGSVTVSAGTTITAAPSPSVITTVSVINGTTTTITMTITAAPAPLVPTTSTIPKAAQSILVIQSTTYGKVLPAAGPVDDHIESHFWDQFSPPDIPGKGKSSSASHRAQSSIGWLFSVFGRSLVMVVCVVSLVVPAWILL